MVQRGSGLTLSPSRKGFGLRDMMTKVEEMLKDPETLLTLAQYGGSAEGERNPLQLAALARGVVKQILSEEMALDLKPEGAEGRYAPEVLSALSSVGMNQAAGRTLVRTESLASGRTVKEVSFERAGTLPERPETEGWQHRGKEHMQIVDRFAQERLEGWVTTDLTAMRDALYAGTATPEQVGQYLRRVDQYREGMGDAKLDQRIGEVFGRDAGEMRKWLEFRESFVSGKKEYWYRVIEKGKGESDKWDQEHYEPLRSIRDSGLKDQTFGVLVQAIQDETWGVHKAYSDLYQAKEGWWQAYRTSEPTESFAKLGAEARGRLVQVDPSGERLWGSSTEWHSDAEIRGQFVQFGAAYGQLWRGLIQDDKAAVTNAWRELEKLPNLYGSPPAREIWSQHEADVKAAYLSARTPLAISQAETERDTARQRVEMFEASVQGGLLSAWRAEELQRQSTAITATGVTDQGVRMEMTLPHQLHFPLPPNTYQMTSDLGIRTNPITGRGQSFHRGTDYGANRGVEIRSAHDGIVAKAGQDEVYGHYVLVKGDDGTYTRYAHMMAPPAVRQGQRVAAGELLGQVGSTGWSTGNHLHFEIYTVQGGKEVYLRAEDVCYLQRGSTGERVKQLQNRLHDLGYGAEIGTPDVTFGPRTERAVNAFQRDRGLAETGIVDEATLVALQSGDAPGHDRPGPGPTPDRDGLIAVSPGVDGIVEGWRLLYGLTPAEEMAVRISATYEGASKRGFATLAGNADGQGVSFGFAQWNLGMGTLQSQLLLPLLRDHPEIFRRHFPNNLTLEAGGRTYTMEQIVGLHPNETNAIRPVIGRLVNDESSPWHKAFINLAKEPEVMKLQLRSAKSMMDVAKMEMTSGHYFHQNGTPGPAKSWKADSPAALALLYDIHKQNGSLGYAWDAIERGLARRSPQSEHGLLKFLAWHVANSSNYEDDVWSRKSAVTEGGGVVHGTNYQFDWEHGFIREANGGRITTFPAGKDPMDYLGE